MENSAEKDRIKRQFNHYENKAEKYVEDRSISLAYSHFMSIWAQNLLQPWLNAFDKKTRANHTVLDPMCGHGVLAPFLLSECKNLLLNDLSPKMLELIPTPVRVNSTILPPACVSELKLDDNSVDLVVISGGLHHVFHDLPKVLKEIKRVLKPNGIFVFGEPSNEFFLVRFMRDTIYRLHPAFDSKTEVAFRHKQLWNFLSEAGFCQSELRPFGSIGYLLTGQSGIITFLKRSKSHRLFSMLQSFDRWIEQNRSLKTTCFTILGSARKPILNR